MFHIVLSLEYAQDKWLDIDIGIVYLNGLHALKYISNDLNRLWSANLLRLKQYLIWL